VAAGAVVPPGLNVPDRMLVIGVPAKVTRPVSDRDLEYMRWLTGHYVDLAQEYAKGEGPRVKRVEGSR
jgi:carbonic anhydrase/acetyltransferase-like protein (isoleucine patch superfamily)